MASPAKADAAAGVAARAAAPEPVAGMSPMDDAAEVLARAVVGLMTAHSFAG